MSDFKVESVSNGTPASGISPSTNCKIRVLGIGGGGGNSLQHMINESLHGVDFIAINTDSQALTRSTSPIKVQIGVKLTNGLGAGCDPNKGRKAAEESREDIKKLLQGSDMVFITAGMGGGTGTGASPIIAEIAKETGALTVAVVTKPFHFEGKRHMVNAESGITELSKHVDSLIVIDNEKLLNNLGANISIINAFNSANDVLLNAVRGITETITDDAFINLDFADVVTVMRGRGHAMIGIGVGQGATFVEDAVERAIHSPLIEPLDISSAAGLLVYAKVNPNFPISKWDMVCKAVQEYADEEADCKFGMRFDESINEDQIEITILITGISASDSNPVNQARQAAAIAQGQKGGFFDWSRSRLGSPAEAHKPAAIPAKPAQESYMHQQQAGNSNSGPEIEAIDMSNGTPHHLNNFGVNSRIPEVTEVPVPDSVSAQKAPAEDDNSGLFDLPPILSNKSL